MKTIYNTMFRRAFALGLFALLGQQSLIADNNYNESDIKAAMLLKIVRYVDYPNAPIGNDAPIKLCIAGQHDITRALQDLQDKSKRIRTRSFQVIQLLDGSLPEDCQVLFLSRKLDTDFIAWIDKAQARPVLTVADSANSAENGVMVNFIPKRNFIGFELNPGAASLSELQFSSELLKHGTLKETTRAIVEQDQETSPEELVPLREDALETEGNNISRSDTFIDLSSKGTGS